MADPNDRVPENVGGEYYVDTNCIDCDVCRDTAPDNFTRADSKGYSFVFNQPDGADQAEDARRRLASSCPLRAQQASCRAHATASGTPARAILRVRGS